MIKNIFCSFQIALSFFTTIPVIKHYDWTKERIRYIPVMFPFVGGIIGVVFSGVLYGLGKLSLSSFSLSFLMVLVGLLLTGGLHHDGLMDAADAIFSRSSGIDRRLEIMKDSRVGAFGVITVIFFTGLMWISFYEILDQINDLFFVIVPIFSRIMAGLIFYHFPYARKEGLAMIFGETVVRTDRLLLYTLFLIITSGGVLLIGIKWLIISIVAIISFLAYRKYTIQKFGGITGDLLGAYVLVMELVFYILLNLL